MKSNQCGRRKSGRECALKVTWRNYVKNIEGKYCCGFRKWNLRWKDGGLLLNFLFYQTQWFSKHFLRPPHDTLMFAKLVLHITCVDTMMRLFLVITIMIIRSLNRAQCLLHRALKSFTWAQQRMWSLNNLCQLFFTEVKNWGISLLKNCLISPNIQSALQSFIY